MPELPILVLGLYWDAPTCMLPHAMPQLVCCFMLTKQVFMRFCTARCGVATSFWSWLNICTWAHQLRAYVFSAAAEEEDEENAAGTAAALALERSAVNKLLAEYDQLDFEDNIGGLKTRFRYRSVPKEDYGLSTNEILRLKDKELNQLVGLKRMAPYREERGKFRPNYGMMKELQVGQQQKQAKWQQRQQDKHQRKAQASQEQPLLRHDTAGAPSTKEPRPDVKAQRMKSFQKLSMNRGKPTMSNQAGTQKKSSKQRNAPSVPVEAAAAGISKAARKNMKRAAKRAAKRPQSAQ